MRNVSIVFVKLPKFKPQTFSEKKMHVLWLRFLTEINEDTRVVPQELLENPEVKAALDMVEESALTPDERARYDGFIDWLRRQKSWEVYEAEMKEKYEAEMKEKYEAEMKEKAKEKLIQAEEHIGKLQSELDEAESKLKLKDTDTARKMKLLGIASDAISQVTGLSNTEIEAL